MKILLANSPWTVNGKQGIRAGSRWPHLRTEAEGDYMPFPFFMAYAGAVLKKAGFNVLLLDAIAESLPNEIFIKKVKDFSPDLALLEVSTPSMGVDIEWAKRIKKETKALVAFAGPDINITTPEFLKRNKQVDFVLIGEYEQTLLDLAKMLESGSDLGEVLGILYKWGRGVVVKNKKRPLTGSIDEFPWPLRDTLPMANYHDSPGGIPRPTAQMWASRGCPFRCKFCAWTQMMYEKGVYRARDPVDVVNEMEHLVKTMGFKSVYFDDDTFNIGKERMLRICDEIKRRNLGIPWAIMARADTMDEEILRALKSAGLHAVKYGVESGAQDIVYECDKNLNLKRVEETVGLTKKLGIKVHLTFMFGLPGETRETIQKTIDFALALDPDSVQFSIATPFPGTEYFSELEARGQIASKRWEDYDGNFKSVIKIGGLDQEELVDAQKKAYEMWDQHIRQRRMKDGKTPRQLFGECLKEHGLLYTFKRTFKYLSRR